MSTLKRRVNINEIFLEYFFIYLILGGYFVEWTLVFNKINLIVFVIAMFYSKKTFTGFIKNKILLFLLFLDCFILLLTIVNSKSQTYTQSNILVIIYYILPVLYFGIIMKSDTALTRNFFIKKCKFLNIWFILNLIIIFIQISGNPVFIRDFWISENPYYPDLCTGLFGKNNGNVFAFFVCFMMIYNFNISKMYYHKKQNTIKIYTVIMIFASLVSAVGNENTAMFFLVPMFALLYLYFCVIQSGESVQKKIKYIFIILVLILIAVIVIFNTPYLHDFINDYFIYRFSKIFLFSTKNEIERIATIAFPFENGTAFKFGYGIGYSEWVNRYLFGFSHFGHFSAGCIITLTGIWFYLTHTVFLSYIIVMMMNLKNKILISFVFIFSVVIISSIYTNIMIYALNTIWLALAFMALNMYSSDCLINRRLPK